MKYLLILLLTVFSLSAQAIDFEIVIPAFCGLENKLNPHFPEPVDPVDDPSVPLPSLKPVSKVYFLCNDKRQTHIIQIEPINPQMPTPLLLSYYPNCKHASSALTDLVRLAWERAYVCSPKNYNPKPYEARITLLSL
jgi:hypothetical protein